MYTYTMHKCSCTYVHAYVCTRTCMYVDAITDDHDKKKGAG